LLAAVFPDQIACAENLVAEREVPDHPLVNQTVHDCLNEAMDIAGLEQLLRGIESGAIRVVARDLTEPSPLALEILGARPYAFLDDAPLEERRTRAVAVRRRLPETARDLGALDAEAIARVREEARPDPRDAEELHDLLLDLVATRPEGEWTAWFEELVAGGRAAVARVGDGWMWLAAERRPAVEALFPGAVIAPNVGLPGAAAMDAEAAAMAMVRGHLACLGPCTADDLVARTALFRGSVDGAVARLEAEGVVLRGSFDPGRPGVTPGDELCERRLLARIHRQTIERLRREIEPVTAQDFVRFLLRWQHVAPDTQVEGREGVLAVIEQLQGFEIAAGAWETSILPGRVAEYRPEWLDDLCLAGTVMWTRLGVRLDGGDGDGTEAAGGSASTPSRATPVSFLVRDNLPWLLAATRGQGSPASPRQGLAQEVLACLRERGALFFGEIVAATGRLRAEVAEGLWDLVARGLVTADGFGSARALFSARERWARRTERPSWAGSLRRRASASPNAEGRWSLLLAAADPLDADPEILAEAAAEQLLARYGVVFRDLLVRETLALPWREVLRALRRMEARGTARGGRFVTGFVGEQYALPEAVEALRAVRRRERTGEIVRVSAVDPLNIAGILTPGPRIPAIGTNTVALCDGVPVASQAGDQFRGTGSG
jgi:ATP-dependent Lhr-like helicase